MLPLTRFERLLEQFDRLPDLLGAKCDLAETGERGRAGRIARLQMGAIEALGLVDLAEPERDLGLDQLQRLERLGVDAGREPLAGDVDAQGELVDHLQRRHPGAGLDPRDVGRGAAGEGELALRQPARSRAVFRRTPTSRGESMCVVRDRGTGASVVACGQAC